MDKQVHDSSSFEYAFSVAQQRHKETVIELHRLREELRARDDVIKRLRASLGERFDAALECRLLKDQLKKLEEGMQKVVLEDKRRQHEIEMPVSDKSVQVDKGAAISGESGASTAAIQVLTTKGKNYVVKLPVEYLADILSFLDRFSLDRAEFTCPKMCAAVATLDGQNLRNLSRLDVTGPANEGHCTCGTCRGRGGYFNCRLCAANQRHQIDQNTVVIVVECYSDPMAMKSGAASSSGNLTWQFADAPTATPHFVGLLRNASVQKLLLSKPSSLQFLQALSAADVDVVVGSLTLGSFAPEAVNLAVGRDALVSFNRLGELAIADAPLDLLSDDFLLAATQKRLTSITLKSDHFCVRVGGGFGGGRKIVASVGPECHYPELSDGLLTFLFRDDLAESAKVELRFPAARVPPDFCQHLMESAISSGTRYSIDALFVPVGDVNEALVGFEEYRRLGDGFGDNVVVYRVPDPNATDIIVELKIATVAGDDDGWGGPAVDEWGAPTTEWKLIEFRRYRAEGTSD